jgi:hypothetical protein
VDLSRYIGQFTDPYERKARLWPGLLVVAPMVVALATRFGVKHPVLGAAASIVAACGGMYGLASIVRAKGKELEERLVIAWGGMPTTIALRHRDPFLDSVSKQRYHDLITRKLGIPMPTADEETAEPAKADDAYIGATKRLRELTRSDRGLLFKENISYGFHRNMLAMKPTGIVVCLISIVYGLARARLIQNQSPYIAPERLGHLEVSTGIALVVSISFLATWLFHFNPASVRRIGFVYAERLFERLPSLKTPPSARRNNGVEAD